VDPILNLFLDAQLDAGLRLAAESDLLEVEPLDAQRFVVVFRCKGLVRSPSGNVIEHDHFAVGIRFPDDFLRTVNPAEILTWLGPDLVFHPNIAPPFLCIGKIVPGTSLTELIHRCFEVISFENVTMREDDSLNHEACAWARRNRQRFPIDTRPLKRRALEPTLSFEEVTS